MDKKESAAMLRFCIPQVITASRVVLGGGALYAAAFHQIDLAATLITLGAVTDGLDGPLARRLGAISEFGALFDYFADYLCYIVAPVMLSLLIAGESLGLLRLIVLGLPLLTGAIRYSRNAGLLKTQAFNEVGIPGLGTVFYAFFIVTLAFLDLRGIIGAVLHNRILLLTVVAVSCLMILPVRYPRLMKFKWISAPILLGFAVMPFMYTRVLAAIALALGFVYTVISPFFLLKSRNTQRSTAAAKESHRKDAKAQRREP
jgi:phosphatidylserine synthase